MQRRQRPHIYMHTRRNAISARLYFYTARPIRHAAAHYAARNTQETHAAAGSRPPPPTLSQGTSSRLQTRTGKSVQSTSRANVATAHSSKVCTKNRPIASRLSSWMGQRLRIVRVIELQRKNQTVNSWKPNGRSGQTARQGNVGAQAGSPGAVGSSGSQRQTCARQSQTSAITC